MRSRSRRRFLKALGAAAGVALPARGAASVPRRGQAPALVRSDRARPRLDYGVAAGDVTRDRALVWAHSDRPGRLLVEYATTDRFHHAVRVRGPLATPDTGLTARVMLTGLPPGQDIFYRVRFEDVADSRAISLPIDGRFRTAPVQPLSVRLAWTADTCGQGWGIDTARGGMQLFETIRQTQPDLFVNVGDTIYADQPLREEVRLDDGSLWRNLVTPAKAKVAETLDEFRGNHLYNRLDTHYRRLMAQVGQVTLWDDHEVRDNWWREQTLEADDRYTEKRVAVLAERARQAFLEHYPIPLNADGAGRVYRTIPYGPRLEVFALDMREYRGPNSANRQSALDATSAFLGPTQVAWLKAALAHSTATWKVIAADMPLGLEVPHAPDRQEAVANGEPGVPLGRELELADLLRFIRDRKIRNVVWITADVHYCAAHHFDPARAAFRDFDPFWEFVAGPAHAGTFNPTPLDATFGPEVRFTGVPPGMAPNRPPSAGLQFFGTLEVAGPTGILTARLHNLAGETIYEVALPPAD